MALAGVAASALCVGVGYRAELAAEVARAAAGSRMAETACGPIEYALLGAGPPLLVIHGAGGGIDQGLDFGAPIAARGFRVVAVSRFGYLRTPLPADASAEAQADAHACLLDTLGIARTAVLGASAGAPSAMQLALRHPERVGALVLLVPAGYAPGRAGGTRAPPLTERLFRTALQSDFLFWLALKASPDALVEGILATRVAVVEAASPAEKARVGRMLEHILPVSRRTQGLLNDAAVVSNLPRYDLARIAAPTLAISFEDDLYGTHENARYIASQVPGARFLSFPTGGHVSVGHDEEVRDAVLRFLREER